MLILTRKPGESLYIGDNLKVTIVEIKGNQIRVGIDAPPEFRIYREEIYLQILEENRKAAEGGISGEALEQLSGSWKGALKGKAEEAGTSSSRRVAITGRPNKQRSVEVTIKGRVQGVGGSESESGASPSNKRGKAS